MGPYLLKKLVGARRRRSAAGLASGHPSHGAEAVAPAEGPELYLRVQVYAGRELLGVSNLL